MSEHPNSATVLVVDDDVDHCMMLEVGLQSLGYHVLQAHSVKDAVALLKKEDVDALLCDLTLGDGTALDVVHGLGERRPRVSIVLSGFDAEEDRERSIAAGFDEHLVKPTSMDVLGEVISRGLSRRKSGIRLAKTRLDGVAQSEKMLRKA